MEKLFRPFFGNCTRSSKRLAQKLKTVQFYCPKIIIIFNNPYYLKNPL